MKIPNPSGLLNLGRAFVSANRPELLFGASIVSTVSGVILAARGGYKSGYTVAEEDIKRQVVGQEKMQPKEIANLTWLNYLPAAGVTLGALGSTTGLHLVHVKEKRQLAAMALMAVEQVKNDAEVYKKDILESVGLAQSDDEKELDKASKKSSLAKVVNSDGEIEEYYLVRDRRTGRDIYSNKLRVEDGLLELNRGLMDEGMDLNTFYGYAGFGAIPDGENLGWNAGERVELKWLTRDIRDDGRPTRPFTFHPEPTENYDASYG